MPHENAPAPGWRTRATVLSLIRAATAPLLVAAIVQGADLVAAFFFAVAVASDFADGHLARRFGEVSRLGGLVDHASDALFVTAGLAALVHLGEIPALLPWLVAAAFFQYVFDSRIFAGRALRASALGRWNGIAYYVLVGVPVVRDALALGWPGTGVVRALGWCLVASTLLSMLERGLALLRNRGYSGPTTRRSAP
jgi:phosphatidylglycerophosphate synthase